MIIFYCFYFLHALLSDTVYALGQKFVVGSSKRHFNFGVVAQVKMALSLAQNTSMHAKIKFIVLIHLILTELAG